MKGALELSRSSQSAVAKNTRVLLCEQRMRFEDVTAATKHVIKRRLMRKLDEASTIDDQCVGRAIRELSLARDGALSLGLDGTEISAFIDYLCRCDPP